MRKNNSSTLLLLQWLSKLMMWKMDHPESANMKALYSKVGHEPFLLLQLIHRAFTYNIV